MSRLPAILTCAGMSAIGLTACGGEGSGGPTETTNEATQPTSTQAGPTTEPAATPGGGNVVVVDMKDIKYVPDKVNVKVGQTVRWTNGDAVAHTVTADRGASFDSGTINAGGKYEWKAAKAGEVHYHCTIHGQQQSGTVTVTG